MRQRGFTLVEIAIVLVLIGIILGAVLKGGDLIDNAKEKQFKSDETDSAYSRRKSGEPGSRTCHSRRFESRSLRR